MAPHVGNATQRRRFLDHQMLLVRAAIPGISLLVYSQGLQSLADGHRGANHKFGVGLRLSVSGFTNMFCFVGARLAVCSCRRVCMCGGMVCGGRCSLVGESGLSLRELTIAAFCRRGVHPARAHMFRKKAA